jgi:hypothetical protein
MLRRNLRRLVPVLCIPLLAGGCFTVQHAYTGAKPMTNGPGLEQPTRVVKHFEVRDRQFFWFHGGVPVGEPLNGLALAGGQIGDHAGVVNLELRDGQDFLDVAVTHIPCLLSLLCGTWSTWAEGDVVDYLPENTAQHVR